MKGIIYKLKYAAKDKLQNTRIVERYKATCLDYAEHIRSASLESIVDDSKITSQKVSSTLFDVFESGVEGLTGLELQDRLLEKMDAQLLAPSMAGYNGFPSALAVSVDDELIHNAPTSRKISSGTMVTVEFGGASKNSYASQTWTFLIGECSEEKNRLLACAIKALRNAIGAVSDGVLINTIGKRIQETIESDGYSVVHDYCGHGMGKERIQDPQIPGFYAPSYEATLSANEIINLHVLATNGKRHVINSSNGWGVRTKDGSYSVALSAMVLVTKDGPKVLSNIPGLD